MIPFEQYLGVFPGNDAATQYSQQICAHFSLAASVWGLLNEETALITAGIRPEGQPDGRYVVVWRHPSAPGGKAVLRGAVMHAADFVYRHALAGRTNYASLRQTFEAVRDMARERGLTLVDETDVFGYDWVRALDTGYGLGIVSAAGYPVQNSYLLYLWPPRAPVPENVSAFSPERIMRAGFTPVRTPLRVLTLDVMKKLHTPVPSATLREQLDIRYGRFTTPRELATVIAKEAFAFGKSPRDVYIVSALDERGKAVRGWYARSDWSLSDRIVPSGSLEQARLRSQDALSNMPPRSWDFATSEAIEVAVRTINALSPHERLFGIKEPER